MKAMCSLKRRKGKKLKAPVSVVFTKHFKPMVIGTFIMVATYSLFYIMTAFAQAYSRITVNPFRSGLSNGVRHSCQYLHGITFNKRDCFAIFISISGLYADKIGRRKWLIWTTVSILIFALCMPLFLGNGTNLRICFLGNWYGINGNDIWPNGGVIA